MRDLSHLLKPPRADGFALKISAENVESLERIFGPLRVTKGKKGHPGKDVLSGALLVNRVITDWCRQNIDNRVANQEQATIKEVI